MRQLTPSPQTSKARTIFQTIGNIPRLGYSSDREISYMRGIVLPHLLISSIALVALELTEHRYLHIRILLFRPFLLALLSCDQEALDKSSNKSLTETVLAKTFLTEISTSCVDAAQSLVKLIADCEDRGSSSLPAWWYNVFCIVSPPLP